MGSSCKAVLDNSTNCCEFLGGIPGGPGLSVLRKSDTERSKAGGGAGGGTIHSTLAPGDIFPAPSSQ